MDSVICGEILFNNAHYPVKINSNITVGELVKCSLEIVNIGIDKVRGIIMKISNDNKILNKRLGGINHMQFKQKIIHILGIIDISTFKNFTLNIEPVIGEEHDLVAYAFQSRYELYLLKKIE